MLTGQNKEEENEYKFIQEKVIPSRRKKWKKILTLGGTAAMLGAVFGLAASVAFCLSAPWVSKVIGQKPAEEQQENSNVQLPEDTWTGPDSAGETGDGSQENEGADSELSESVPPDSDPSEGTDGPEGETGQQEGQNPEEDKPEQIVVEQRIAGDLTDYKNIYHEISQTAAQVNRSVVRVAGITNGVDWFQNPYATENETSGLILAEDENQVYILVNYESIRQASEIRITFEQGVLADAAFRDADADIGMAVVTVQKSDLPERILTELQTAPLGESYSLEVGEPVMALGSPNGFLHSMLLGVVTNRDNYAYVPDNRLTLFHTDMKLTEGGEGIIVNMDGKIVGVITRTLEGGQGLCTVLSISNIKPLLEQLMNQTPRNYLGVVGVDLPETLAERLEVVGGVYVAEVRSNSPAALAGIRAGDVILQAGDTSVFSVSALSSCIQNQEPGDVMVLKVCRMVREDAVTDDYEVTLAQKNVPAR